MFHSPKDFGNFSWRYDDDKDDLAKEAFRAVMLITCDPQIYEIPSDGMLTYWKQQSMEKFGYRYGPDEQVTAINKH